MDRQDLEIATWNVNGMLNKKHDIEVLVNTHHMDICLIFETHMTNCSGTMTRDFIFPHAITSDQIQ